MEQKNDEVHELLAAIVSTLNNTLYDLATENERAGAKVTANRLEFSRKKVMNAWEVYNTKRSNK